MMHPDTELRHCNDKIGLGVFATRDILCGTIVYVKDWLDIDVTPAAYRNLDALTRSQIDRYSYLEPHGSRVLSWDLAKYVNHSCHANTMSAGWGFEIAIVDIRAGEEITDEYGLLNLYESMLCACRASGCRGRISSTDIEILHESWDDSVRTALQSLRSAPQPLWEIMAVEQRTDLEAYLHQKAAYRSVLELCPPNVFRVAGVGA